MFNPIDEKYGLLRKGIHMNKDIMPYVRKGDYRTIHITENRDGPSPTHLAYRFRGAVKRFEYLSHLPESKK